MKCDPKRLWYHGDVARRLTFTDQRFQNRDAPNAAGPGIYFTESQDQARGYAWPEGWLYTVRMKPAAKCVSDEQRMTPRELRRFLALLDAEGREYLFSNWDEDPRRALAKIAEAYTTAGDRDDRYVMNLVSAAADLGRQGGLDYMTDGRAWAHAMTQLGYAAFLHRLPALDHLIVWDPGAFTVVDEEFVPRRAE